MRKKMNQRRDRSPVAIFVLSLMTDVILLIAIALAAISITMMIVFALIPIYLPIKQMDAVCPVNCTNSCTKLCLRNFVQCNPQSRQITIVTTNDYVPFISQNGTNSPTGFDVDLMNYIATLIGVQFTYQYKKFSELISTVQNNINTISISVQTDTIAREAFVNFAQFFQTGIAFMIRSDSGLSINNLSDLCGKKVVVITGSIQVTDVQTQNTKCGSQTITILYASTITEARNAVQNGSAQVRLDDEALCCSLVNAINYLIQHGIYQNLFPQYSFNYTQNGICPSRLNLNGTTCTSSCVPNNNICTN